MKVPARSRLCRNSQYLPQFTALFFCLWVACFALEAQEVEPASKAPVAANASGVAFFDATSLRAPTTLGPRWAVIAGDDPAYAQADFDDRKWALLDLKQSLKSIFPKTKPEVVWYRLHVKVDPTETELAIAEHNISTAFEIYINGKRVLKTGSVSPFKPYTNSARILMQIPKAQCASGWLVIALRVYLSRSAWSEPNPGLISGSLVIGEENELEEHSWLRAIGRNATYWVNLLLVFGLGMVALALFIAQPRHREYLWIFLQFVAQAAALPWSIILLFHEMPAPWGLALLPINMLNFLFLALMYLAFLRQRFTLWMRIYFGFTGALVVGSVIGVSTGIMPTVFLGIILVPFLLFLNLVVPILLIVHLRRGNREAGILLIPALLTGATSYVGLAIFFVGEIPSLAGPSSRLYDLLFASKAGPFTLSLEDFANLLFNLSLLLILVLRSIRMSRQQAVFQGELEAARELQQVIVPEQADAIPGFVVESVYEPAQQVGGDFFQVLATQDGGLLVVVGDVAGKGLPAAMLVSVMVGAIRATAEYTHSPEVLLASLNERLVGRSRGGFSTALVAKISARGEVTIANAGHLSPYLDGHEIELPGALPLGIMSGAQYEVTRLELAPGSRLTFYSDGVIEAQNQKGELFGFERGQEISTQSAVAIVEAAKLFGQSDDITVVAIKREAAFAQAA